MSLRDARVKLFLETLFDASRRTGFLRVGARLPAGQGESRRLPTSSHRRLRSKEKPSRARGKREAFARAGKEGPSHARERKGLAVCGQKSRNERRKVFAKRSERKPFRSV